MKKILIHSLVIVLLSSSCASRPIKIVSPPSYERIEVLRNSLSSREISSIIESESEDLAKDYLRALKAEKDGDQETACEIFQPLSKNLNLAIKEAALVHSLSNCSFSASQLKEIWKRKDIPTYLKENYIEQSLKLASMHGLLEYEARFSYEMTFYKSVQIEKLKLIKKSINIAEKLNDEDALKIYSERLKEISPLYNADVNDLNIFKIAKDFEANRKFEMARSLYKKIFEGNFSIDEKVKAFSAYKTSYKVERDLKTFIIKSLEMEAFLKEEMNKNPNDVKTAEYWVDAKIAYIRSVWTDHRNQEARKLLKELIATNLGSENQKATMRLIFGSLHLESKENETALKFYKMAGTFKVNDSALAENIQWAIVWNNYLLKKYREAHESAEAFSKGSSNPIFTAKLSYWNAKALLKLNQVVRAKEIFNQLILSDPYGYYGLIASIDLKKPLEPIPPTVINKELTGILVLDWLIAMNEKVYSQKYLKEIDSQFKTPEQRERVMSLYSQTEWYQGGMRQIYNFKMSSRNELTSKYINVVYPAPYWNTVTKLSQKYSVPKELVYAITRQESAFVPNERSWADAFGLMQMIPEKAIELSQKYQIPYQDYNDLYKPEVNLEMGTALLSELIGKYQVKFVHAVASYNASEEAIAVWERERFNGNYFEFIEMIPYEETRNYIKLVFRNYITYKRITASAPFVVKSDFFLKAFEH